MKEGPWSDAHFDQMNWHDNHVHGIGIREGQWGAGELSLDIDYILEWLPAKDGTVAFRIAPARLTFSEVTDLRIDLDYASASAGLGPFSMDGISRAGNAWTITVNWPPGSITFSAAGFVQTLTGSPVVSKAQCLTAKERTSSGLS